MAITADITIAQTAGSDTAAYPYMLAPGSSVMQDITPASVRRSDGDTRFQTLQTEGFYSQSNWKAGFGVRNQLDPNAYFQGGVDTTYEGQAVCGQSLQDVSIATRHPILLIESGTDLYGMFQLSLGTACVLYKRTGLGAGTWTATGYTTATPPVCGCAYRNKLYFGFGTTAFAEETDGIGAGTLMAFKAQVIEPYSSMLHYVYWDTVKLTWRLGRYDPDNANTLDVAAFTLPLALVPQNILAAYGALYVTFPDTLWQYTSQNGNSGVLSGPVDRWAMTYFSGRALEAHNGAIVYGAGPLIRRYPPGGSPRTLYPTPPREATNATGWGEPVGLRSVSGRLYVAVTYQNSFLGAGNGVIAGTTNFIRIHAWTDLGMHRIAWADHAYNTTTAPTKFCMAYDRQSSLFVGNDVTLTKFSTGVNAARIVLPILTGNIVQDAALLYPGLAPVYQTSTLETGRLEFGLADVLKSLRRLRYRNGTGGTVALEYTTDDTAWIALTPTGVTYVAAGPYDQGFTEVAVPAGGTATARWFRFRATLTPGASGATTPVLTAVVAIPNPAMPLRNGFKLTIPIGRHVEDYEGNLMYPDEASVAAAFARVKAWRATGDNLDPATNAPLSLVWVDGTTYTVRANTRVIQRVKTPKNIAKQYVIILDLQEIT